MSRQYLTSGKVVDEVVVNNKSFKGYCSTIKIGKIDYLLAAETLKYYKILDKILYNVGCNIKKLDVKYGIFLVMLYELLFGKKKISGGGVVKRKVMEYYDKCKIELDKLMLEKKYTSYMELLPKHMQEANNISNFIRVNEIKMNIADGLTEVKKIVPIAVIDEHIPSLIMLPPTSRSLGEHPYVKDGQFIIQDKASCMPSQILYDAWLTQKNKGIHMYLYTNIPTYL